MNCLSWKLFKITACCRSGHAAGGSRARAHAHARARLRGNGGRESSANESRVTRQQPEDLPAENTAV